MDRTQAETAAQALLDPELHARESEMQARQRREEHARTQRRHGLFALAGFLVAGGIGLLVFERIGMYGMIGAFAGLLCAYGYDRCLGLPGS
ncbi:MAG: hypothetical protein A2579_10505 [Lysobacterales bacterium RIFOXYD1_FULL_69_11]|nr:MAG: hypothetical protein A2190_12460 [Xanthomonadales bacterium RIFOXYA1_FULL_69_10]OHE87152.1 MAG: hypothetical protein A2579_10505 [Xanthomonadales bacterium RIFOXYD1_FULL_69_11]